MITRKGMERKTCEGRRSTSDRQSLGKLFEEEVAGGKDFSLCIGVLRVCFLLLINNNLSTMLSYERCNNGVDGEAVVAAR